MNSITVIGLLFVALGAFSLNPERAQLNSPQDAAGINTLPAANHANVLTPVLGSLFGALAVAGGVALIAMSTKK